MFFWDMGNQATHYLSKLHKDAETPASVAWFPGPEHAAPPDAFDGVLMDTQSLRHTPGQRPGPATGQASGVVAKTLTYCR